MHFTTGYALLALATFSFASPVDNAAIEKRATCTVNGFRYSCAGATSSATSTRAATTSSIRTTSATSTGSAAAASGTTGYSTGATANDVINKVCAPLTVIFARGTSESGNIGSISGPPMFKQLSTDLSKKVALQGVDYAADSAGNSNCGQAGSATMVALVKQALAQCPGTKIAISGYSQGACVVHVAAKSLDASQIQAVVTFGDPYNGQAVGSVPASKVLSICGSSDSICNRGPTNVSGGHTSYGSSAAKAASFIEQTTGVTA